MENYITSTSDNYYNLATAQTMCGISVSDCLIGNKNKNKNMKEENLKKFKIVFEETIVKEITFELLAENLEQAKEKIEKGSYIQSLQSKEEIISINRKIK